MVRDTEPFQVAVVYIEHKRIQIHQKWHSDVPHSCHLKKGENYFIIYLRVMTIYYL